MNEAENKAENSELLSQEGNNTVSDEKQVGVDAKSETTESNVEQGKEQGDEKPEVSADAKQDNDSESESDNDSFEWNQKRTAPVTSASPTDNGDGSKDSKVDSSIEALQKRIQELEAKVSEKENLLIQIQGVQEDPIIKSWFAIIILARDGSN
jgi:hypothetical protein